jgi:DNA-binding transcriptional regulator YdaS (Cro superfamily)
MLHRQRRCSTIQHCLQSRSSAAVLPALPRPLPVLSTPPQPSPHDSTVGTDAAPSAPLQHHPTLPAVSQQCCSPASIAASSASTVDAAAARWSHFSAHSARPLVQPPHLHYPHRCRSVSAAAAPCDLPARSQRCCSALAQSLPAPWCRRGPLITTSTSAASASTVCTALLVLLPPRLAQSVRWQHCYRTASACTSFAGTVSAVAASPTRSSLV